MRATSCDPWFEELRRREFGRLDAQGHVYLDYTGSGLYPASLVRQHAELLCSCVAGNPHSRSPASRRALAWLEEARARVLQFFDADPAEYEVVFTANATGALKLVGEGFPFEPGSRLALAADNHNSVLGIREYARARGAEVRVLPLTRELRLDPDGAAALEGADPSNPHLFAYPAQSNFSGVQHPDDWTATARRLGYAVLLDAAAYVPTNPLSLRRARPDYVCVSFYKMFGYPTGVGALLARREALARLRRPWFAGGTVRYSSAQNPVHIPYEGPAAFEEGTLNFLSLPAVTAGLEFLAGIGMARVHAHVAACTRACLDRLAGLRHGNGAPLVRVHGPATLEDRGGCIAFSLVDPDGRVVDCRSVEARALDAGISLRTGRFCNPGAAEYAFEYDAARARDCYDRIPPRTFTLAEFSRCMDGKPVGAVRVSFGLATQPRDLDRLADCLATFLDTPAPAVFERATLRDDADGLD